MNRAIPWMILAIGGLGSAGAGFATPRTASPPSSNSVVLTLTPSNGQGNCLPDRRLCLEPVSASTDASPDRLRIHSPLFRAQAGDSDGASARFVDYPLARGDVANAVTPWTMAIRVDGDATRERWVIGFISSLMTGYSGGGAQVSQLHLYPLTITSDAVTLGEEMVDVPLGGSFLIRACFSERDSVLRRGVCHDEYEFEAEITAAPAAGSDGAAFPVLRYSTTATNYPRSSRRMEDNSGTQLRQSDLVRGRDAQCSFTRALHYNLATLRYELDRPLPDCSQYWAP